VCLLHKSLSRHHARFDVAADRVVLVDLESKNGTVVDGQRIRERVLGAAHEIQFGSITATYRNPALAPSAAPLATRSIVADVTRMAMRDLLSSRAEVAGGSMLNLPVASGAERDRDKLRVLLKVSQLLSAPSSLDTLLSSVLDLVLELLDVDRAAILMGTQPGGPLETRTLKTRRNLPGGDRAVSQSIARYVVEHSVAALFADAPGDARLGHAGSVLSQDIRTSMCAPLKPHDVVLGVLYVDNLTRRASFHDEDLEFLVAFANQAAIAIENAMLGAKLAVEAVTRSNLLRFFPPAAVRTILDRPGFGLEPVETEATMLFSDITGYTEMSSGMKPTEVIALLNAYFPVMAEIVFRHEGTLEKYIGDALFAVWGAPVKHDDDPARAVRAAIEMQRAARTVEAKIGRPLAIHVGINTGVVAGGNVGSNEYIQYATIGDATNVASRICGVAKPGEILVDERTARCAAGAVGLTQIGPVELRGKAAPVVLYRVDGA
jgi:adenylate cyclase